MLSDITLYDFHLYIFFDEVSVRSLAHFLIGFYVSLLLYFKCSLYILNGNPYHVPFANIFSQSLLCLLILLDCFW